MGVLDQDKARRTYDGIGARQDTQAFYEDPATDLILRHGEFAAARDLFEFGCGTGRFAEKLLAEHLPPSAHYRGIDLSPEMVRLARARLARFGARADVRPAKGGPPGDEPPSSCDRFVSNYVFDLLSHEDIGATIGAAHRMLQPGGLLCVCGLARGVGPLSRAVAGL
ncbi:MAG: class I SAM-dependent methyltransferase, partial [Candidatus Methylophosphatis roskildensis]